jgi:hypothetical protein
VSRLPSPVDSDPVPFVRSLVAAFGLVYAVIRIALDSVKIGHMKAAPTITEDSISLSPRSRFQAAMVLAMAADALQIIVFPLFAEGALSPADDGLDLAVAVLLVNLLGWHWEFLPAFLAELVPGVDLVPFWTLAVANVYRKWKQITITTEEAREQRPALKGQQTSS